MNEWMNDLEITSLFHAMRSHSVGIKAIPMSSLRCFYLRCLGHGRRSVIGWRLASMFIQRPIPWHSSAALPTAPRNCVTPQIVTHSAAIASWRKVRPGGRATDHDGKMTLPWILACRKIFVLPGLMGYKTFCKRFILHDVRHSQTEWNCYKK